MIIVTQEQISRLAYLLWEAYGHEDLWNWEKAESYLTSGKISPNDPDPINTIQGAEL